MYYIALSALALFVIGLPLSVLLFSKIGNRKSVPEIFILASIISPLIVNYLIFTLGYAGLLSRQSVFIASLAVIFVPFSLKSVRVSFKNFCSIAYRQIRNITSSVGKLTFLEALPLSLIISVLIITFYSAFMLSPQLRDPHAVWLFYGKKVLETKTVPLFYGNGYDISWSGNYPPLFSFLTSYYFIVLDQAIPEVFTHVPWLYGALTFLATYLLARELGLDKAALLPASMLTTSSIFTLELINYGYITVAWAFYVVTTCFYLIRLVREENLCNLLMFGLSLGALLLSTYLSLVFVASLVALLVISILIQKIFKGESFLKPKPLVFGLIIGSIILLPWLTRNYILLGNPVYPWFYELFGGKGINPTVMCLVSETHRTYELQQLLVDNTFSALSNEDLGYTLLVIGLIGALYLALRSKGSSAFIGKLTLTFFIFMVASMILIHGYERYLLMVAPLLTISAGYLLHKVFFSRGLKIIVVISILLFSLPNYLYLVSLAPYGATFRETQFLYYIEDYIDNYLPSTTVILTNEIQLYFINREVINMYNMPEVLQTQSLTELIDLLKSRNVTHILTNDNIDIDFFEKTFFWSSLTRYEDVFDNLMNMPPYNLYQVKGEESL